MTNHCKVCNKKEATHFECEECYTKGFENDMKEREKLMDEAKMWKDKVDKILKLLGVSE